MQDQQKPSKCYVQDHLLKLVKIKKKVKFKFERFLKIYHTVRVLSNRCRGMAVANKRTRTDWSLILSLVISLITSNIINNNAGIDTQRNVLPEMSWSKFN